MRNKKCNGWCGAAAILVAALMAVVKESLLTFPDWKISFGYVLAARAEFREMRKR